MAGEVCFCWGWVFLLWLCSEVPSRRLGGFFWWVRVAGHGSHVRMLFVVDIRDLHTNEKIIYFFQLAAWSSGMILA